MMEVGDLLEWEGVRGKNTGVLVLGKCGEMLVMTDETHCLPLLLLQKSRSFKVVEK